MTQEDVEQWVHADVGGGEPQAELLDESADDVGTVAFFTKVDLKEGVGYPDQVVRPERQEEHDDDEEYAKFDLLLPLVVFAARVPVRLDHFFCDADVTNGDDQAHDPEVNIEVNDDLFMEFQSMRVFEVHTTEDLCQLNYGFVI